MNKDCTRLSCQIIKDYSDKLIIVEQPLQTDLPKNVFFRLVCAEYRRLQKMWVLCTVVVRTTINLSSYSCMITMAEQHRQTQISSLSSALRREPSENSFNLELLYAVSIQRYASTNVPSGMPRQVTVEICVVLKARLIASIKRKIRKLIIRHLDLSKLYGDLPQSRLDFLKREVRDIIPLYFDRARACSSLKSGLQVLLDAELSFMIQYEDGWAVDVLVRNLYFQRLKLVEEKVILIIF